MNRPGIAWTLAAASVALGVVDTVMNASFRSLLSQDSVAIHGWPLATLATAGSAAMGALIISRHPRSVIGWLLTAAGFLSAVGLVAESYAVWVANYDGPGGAGLGQASAWLSTLVGSPVAFALLSWVLLLAPDGTLLSPRWRVAGAAALVGVTSWTCGVLLTPPSAIIIDRDETRGPAVTKVLFSIGVLLLLGTLLAALVSVLIRLRRARGELRQQLRWIAVWAATLPAGIIILLVFDGAAHSDITWLARMPLMISYALLPICLGISVLRYRLYDIDVIINRAVVLAAGTAFAAAGYVAVVVGAGALVRSQADSFWLSVLATALIALAFQPLRRKVVRLADRLAYGSRAAPYEALAAFSRELGESPDERQLLSAIAYQAARAVGAAQATVRLTGPDGNDRAASWPPAPAPAAEAPATVVPVVGQGQELGSISVRMPAGRTLRRGDSELLADLAAQAGLAFRNARLAAELADRVELLDRQAGELASSRARVIEARDAERARLERSIRRDVISHLAGLPAELAELGELARDPAVAPPDEALERMIEQSIAALEALRELTRGIYSTQLAEFGLVSAVGAHLRRRDRANGFSADEEVRATRFGPRIESAAYFCYVAAVRELSAPVTVELAVRHSRLMITLRAGISPTPDLLHLQDRLDPLAGGVAWLQAAERSVLTITLPAAAG